MITYKIWLNRGLNIIRERKTKNYIRMERIFRNGNFVGSRRGYGCTSIFLMERSIIKSEKNKTV